MVLLALFLCASDRQAGRQTDRDACLQGEGEVRGVGMFASCRLVVFSPSL